MSVRRAASPRAFRKTDESKQSLIVGFTICSWLYPLFSGVSRPTAHKPIPLAAPPAQKLWRTQRAAPACGRKLAQRPLLRANPRASCTRFPLKTTSRSRPLPCLPSPVGPSGHISHNRYSLYGRYYLSSTAQICLLYRSPCLIGDKCGIDGCSTHTAPRHELLSTPRLLRPVSAI